VQSLPIQNENAAKYSNELETHILDVLRSAHYVTHGDMTFVLASTIFRGYADVPRSPMSDDTAPHTDRVEGAKDFFQRRCHRMEIWPGASANMKSEDSGDRTDSRFAPEFWRMARGILSLRLPICKYLILGPAQGWARPGQRDPCNPLFDQGPSEFSDLPAWQSHESREPRRSDHFFLTLKLKDSQVWTESISE
jgi:hypothetical protein